MAYSLVQSNIAAYGGNAGSRTIAFLSNVTAGNLLVVSVAGYNGLVVPTTQTPTDTLSHTYVPAVAQQNIGSASHGTLRTWYVENCSGGANTLTIDDDQTDASSQFTIVISEWSGIAISSSVDNTHSNTGNGTNSLSAGAANTTNPTDLIYSIATHFNGNASFTESDTLIREEENGASFMPVNAQHRRVTSTGSQDATWNALMTAEYAAHWVAFKEATTAVSREQEGYRFRADDGSESTASWLTSQDTNISRDKLTPARLRILTNVANDAPSEGVKLQYRRVGDAAWRDL